jgi:O-antigen/teichoic acid export membrane protein
MSSAIGFIKVLLLASLIGPSNFGHYISLYAVAVFSATFLSFGTVESTLKQFTRSWADGELECIVVRFRQISKILAIRFVILFVIVMPASTIFGFDYSVIEILSIHIMGYGTSLLLLYASIIRASESLRHQKLFYIVRALLAFVPTMLLGFFYSWKGALVGEALGVVFAILYASSLCKNFGLDVFLLGRGKQLIYTVENTGGGRLYIAFMLSSGIAQLDKFIVNQGVGAAQAGTYGVAAIIFQMSGLIVNIVTQRVGTKFIKLNFTKTALRRQVIELVIWLLGFIIFAICLISGVFIVKLTGLATGLIEQYNITNEILLYSGLIAALQIYSMLDFFLIAHDREKDVLYASICAFFVFIMCFLWGFLHGLSIELCLIFVLLTRLCQVALQAMFVGRIIFNRRAGVRL